MLKIKLSRFAEKQLRRIPEYVAQKFDYWCDLATSIGLLEIRKYKGFHDEPLKGKRKGQRSVRLSKAYRAIYIEVDGSIELIEVLEVSKHDY